MNSHFPASQKSNYSSLQADEFICGLSLQCRHTHAHWSAWWMLMNLWSPSIFLSQSMGFDICSKHEREDKQASVIFNKRNSVKGSKQNLPSVYATHKRNKFKCWAFEGKQWEEKQPLSKKKNKPKKTKENPPKHHILTEPFWRGKKGKNRWRRQ